MQMYLEKTSKLITGIQPDDVLTPGSRPTLPQCGKEGVVLYGLRSRDVNDDDDNECTTT